jgi:hypothetical protein
MTVVVVIAIVIAVVTGCGAIIVPRMINRRNDPEDHTDSQAYLEETGRSAEDIERGNDGPSPGLANDAGSRRADGIRSDEAR